MPKLHIEGRQAGLRDPQRNFLWEIFIPDFNNSEPLEQRVKSISIPGRSVDPIETYFYGNKQVFTGRTSFPNSITITFEEGEDQKILQLLYEWFQTIYNTDFDSAAGGISNSVTRKDYAKQIILTMYKYNGEQAGKRIMLINSFPQSLPDVTLDYSGNELIRYDVTFSYDLWKFID